MKAKNKRYTKYYLIFNFDYKSFFQTTSEEALEIIKEENKNILIEEKYWDNLEWKWVIKEY